MKITLYNTGKTNITYIQQGIDDYRKRICHFVDFSIIDLPAVKHKKNISPEILINKEGEIILSAVSENNLIILLDEKGREYTTREFASWLEQMMNKRIKKIAFVTGGAYGLTEKVYNASQFQVSLSKMTLPHQLIRLFFVEQLYRALTIIRGIPYHND